MISATFHIPFLKKKLKILGKFRNIPYLCSDICMLNLNSNAYENRKKAFCTNKSTKLFG